MAEASVAEKAEEAASGRGQETGSSEVSASAAESAAGLER
jgi:hypothetical protein